MCSESNQLVSQRTVTQIPALIEAMGRFAQQQASTRARTWVDARDLDHPLSGAEAHKLENFVSVVRKGTGIVLD